MATPDISVNLPVNVTVDKDRKLKKKDIADLYKFISEDQNDFNRVIQSSRRWKSVDVSNILLGKENVHMSFKLSTSEELEQFHRSLKEGVLSKKLTDYAAQKSYHLLLGLDYKTMLKFDIVMDEDTYIKAKLDLNAKERCEGSNGKKHFESVSIPLQNHPGLKEIKITTSSKEAVVKKEIILVEPSEESGKMASVSLMLKEKQKPNCVETIKMEKRSDEFWCASFSISVDISVEDLEFWFSAEVSSTTLIVFSRQCRKESEGYYQLSHEHVQRVLWKEWSSLKRKYGLVELEKHYKDIVFHCEKYGLRDCIMQIESLIKEYTLVIDAARSLFRSVLDQINEKDIRHQLLIFILLGNLFPSMTNVEWYLSNTAKINMITALKHFRASDLTKSCSPFMLNRAWELFKCCKLNSSYCFITFLCATYPFFDAIQLSDKLIEIVRYKEPISPNEKDLKARLEVLDIFRRMMRDANEPHMQSLMKQLIRLLPVKIAVDVYLGLKEESGSEVFDRENVQASFFDSLQGSVIAFLKSSQRTYGELLEIWKAIKNCQELKTSNIAELENAVLQKLSKGNVSEKQILKDILIADELFDSLSLQMELFKVLKNVKVVKLQLILFEIFCHEKFKESGLQADAKWFKGCFENAFAVFQKALDRELKLREVYNYLSTVRKASYIVLSEELCEVLDALVVEFFKHCDLKRILGKIGDIEEISRFDPSVGELFRVQFKKFLERESTISLYHVLNSCKTAGELRINSRVTADIVCTIMDLADVGRKQSILDQFLNLTSQFEIWYSILRARGTEKGRVKQCSSYLEAVKCIHKMGHSLKNGEIHYGYLTYLSKKTAKRDIIDILITDSALTEKQLNASWEDIVKTFQTELEHVSSSIFVLTTIQSKLCENIIPDGMNELLKELEVLKRNIEKGTLTASQLKERITERTYLSDIRMKSSFLQYYVRSKIFWNSCKEVVETNFKEHVGSQKVDSNKGLIEIPSCDKEISIETEGIKTKETIQTQADMSGFTEPFMLLNVLIDNGISEYKNAWNSLINEHEKDVTFALKLLEGSDVGQEIKFLEEVKHEPIPPDVKATLHLLEDINLHEYTVTAVRKSLDVFGINLDDGDVLFKAIDAFDKIRKNAGDYCPFSLVITSLKQVQTMSEELSVESVDILHALGESPSLVEFLKQIVEEDIRNLIDAVEDISEQYVQESTVSALIEVKSFLQTVLEGSVGEGLGASDFITKVNRQTKELSNSSSKLLPAKIDECVNSLHNLKSLYGNVANRGEITAEIIGNIIKAGEFDFQIDKYGVCDFSARYKSGSRGETQSKHTLIDLRSRALLLMNTRTKTYERKVTSENLEAFVLYIDICNEIAELCEELHQSGNTDFLAYTTRSACSDLALLRNTLDEKAKQWAITLSNLREKYYLLNFIHGPEIHKLYHFFEKDSGFETVVTILQFIHRDIALHTLLKEYKRLKAKEVVWSNEMMLEYFGKTLHFGYKTKSPVERKFQKQIPSKKVTDVVQNRKLFVAALDENSSQVVKTLLSLYHNTTQTLPEPYQVLICTHDTTWNELELLLKRCFGAYKFTGIHQLFCISNIELLTNELQFRLVEELKNISTQDNYLLAIICRGSAKHPFLDELNNFTSNSITTLSDEAVRQIFQSECPEVITFTSSTPGLGKSNMIKRNAFLSKKQIIKLHISGPLIKKNIIQRLSEAKVQKYQALHIDIGSVDDPVELDTFMFELIILRHVAARFQATCLETNTVYIEIANTINDSLRNSLSTVMSFKREHLIWGDYNDYIISMEVNSPVQVVCHYLQCLDAGDLDRKDIFFSGKAAENPLQPLICRNLLRKYLPSDSETSFSVVNIFLCVLADQLKKMACSSYFRVSRVAEMVGHKTKPTVRSTLVEALVQASKEFASRSIQACRNTQLSATGAREDIPDMKIAELSDMLKQKVEGMIRWEDSNHLIFTFHNQNIQTISPLYRAIEIVPSHIKTLFESQMKRALQNFKQMSQKELQSLLQKIARTDPQPLAADKINALNSEYALTPDNLLKMVLIMMRVKSHIPVIVMGETGCGKTSLIRYLSTISDVDVEVLPIHAGVQEKVILDVIYQNNKKALISPEKEVWLFLDEINTSEHIGVMNDAICSNSCTGKELAPNLTVMGACNPYRIRSESAISTAGLKGKIKTDELSKLVYRVLPLPERMVDYVWDFGSLSDADERLYIGRMVDGVFRVGSKMAELLQDVLSASQRFVRQKEDVSYCVSLRDVQRCKTLVKWFLKIFHGRRGLSQSVVEERSIILALAICYHSRFALSDLRKLYRRELGQLFVKHGLNRYDSRCILDVIVEEQKDLLNRMELPVGTAKNSALQENVFVILHCLFTKIPIFLVGKPGCSKSLSMQVIRSNLRGKDSKDQFFKTLPQLYCVSFQGSESSTSDGIIKVFEKAIRYQKSNNENDVLSVVILDEIGLAEISKYNPLKVLHSLLEPDGRSQPDVAVVGISNWSLDASKMNRGIHLSRPDMDEDELYQTGVSICESLLESKKFQLRSGIFCSGQIKFTSEALNDVLMNIAKSYLQYTEKLRYKNFHGLRDFYALAKFVSEHFLEKDKTNDIVLERDRDKIVYEGLQRNFGGLPAETATLFEMFQIRKADEAFESISILKLMKDNINDRMARHLMCITSGESAMSLIENLLIDMGREERVVIFGSHFEEDQTADYNYRILSRIILCMEQGYVLILRDLENVYGSLYDMLNQNYTIIGKKKHCRVALGHYSNPICHVHDDFRCIVLVSENKVDMSDPPFLNRFEKQYLKITDIVNSVESSLILKLEEWLDQFCSVEGCHFDATDCFAIYNKDLIPSLVLKICQSATDGNALETTEILNIAKNRLLYIAQPDSVFRTAKSTSSQIRAEAGQIKEEFLNLPVHLGIWNLIDSQINRKDEKMKGCMTVVLTNSSIHIRNTEKELEYCVQVEKLSAFKSEKQLSLRIQHFWMESEAAILFLHCSVLEDEKHIPLAKSTVENIRLDALKVHQELSKRVYLFLHLDRRRSETRAVPPINFLSGWDIVTLDSVEEPSVPLSELSSLNLYSAVNRKRPLTAYVIEQLFWGFTRIKYLRSGRGIDSILKIIEQMKQSERLLGMIEELICDWIDSEMSSLYQADWLEQIAFDAKALNESSMFMLALEQKLTNIIKLPLSKLLYQLENINALASYFHEDEFEGQRKRIWEDMVHDPSVFDIKDLPDESGPECYLCTASDLSVKMPLSKIIFEKIEGTKDEFMESFLFLKGNLDLEEEDDMPKEVLEELFSQHENLIQDVIPDIQKFMYANTHDDYFHDFSNFVSHGIESGIDQEKKIKIMNWILIHKIHLQTDSLMELFVKLHATVWIFSSVIKAEYLLSLSCVEVLDAEENFFEFLEIRETDSTCESSERRDQIESNYKAYSHFLAAKISTGCLNSADDHQDQVDSQTSKTEDSESDTLSAELIMLPNNEISKEKEIVDTCSIQKSAEEVKRGSSSEDNRHERERTADSDIRFTSEKNVKLTLDQKNTNLENNGSHGKEAEVVSECHKTIRFTSNKIVSTCMSNDEAMEAASERLVSYVSQKLLPTVTCMDSFKTFKEWNNRVSAVLTLALQISCEPKSFHALRFCQDVVCILNLCQGDRDCDSIMKLASILKESDCQTLDSAECYECVCSIVFSDPNPSLDERHCIFAAYLNRCLEADETSQVMEYLLEMIRDQSSSVYHIGTFKPALQTALLLEKVEPNEQIFHDLLCIENKDICATEHPFLFVLDETLKCLDDNSEVISQFSVLVIDILESFFMERFADCSIQTAENEIHNLLSAHRMILQEDYSFHFLNAIAYYKAFIKAFARFIRDGMLCAAGYQSLTNGMQAVMSYSNNPSLQSIAMQRYLLKEIGIDMLPWTFHKLCERTESIVDILPTVEWLDVYPVSCLEGNPLLLCIDAGREIVESAILEKDITTQEKRLKTILSNSDDKMVLSVYAIIISWFYIARSYKQQDDTHNELAKKIQNIAENENMDSPNLQLLSCLLGRKEFLHFSDFDMKVDSSDLQVVIAAFSTSLFSLLLSSNQRSKCEQLSLLAKCLLVPSELKLASFDTQFKFEIEPLSCMGKVFTCLCGYRCIKEDASHDQPIHCPVCDKELNKLSVHSFDEKRKISIGATENFASKHLLAEKLINLFMQACLKGSIALNFTKVEDMESLLDCSEIDIPETLNNRVVSCFQDIMELLDMTFRDTYLFLQTCLYHLREFVCYDKNSCNSNTDFNIWTEKFEQLILPLASNRYEVILEVVRKCAQISKTPRDALELSVGEHDVITSDLKISEIQSSLFRMQGQPSFRSLRFEVDILQSGFDHPYPFLTFVLQVLPELKFTKHVLPLIQWHLATVAHIGYRMKKHECLEMSVKEFILVNQSIGGQELLQKRFKMFQDALSDLLQSKNVLQTRIPRITNLSKMKMCLLLNKESLLYKLISELVNIQNNFLDIVLQISSEKNCQALRYLSRPSGAVAIPCNHVWDVKKSSIICFEWNDSLLQFSHADLRYGYGRYIKYELEAIEKSLALDLVVNKCHLLLDENLPYIDFVDEFYKGYATLAKEICFIVPQKTLPAEIQRSMRKKGDEQSGVTAELITHIGIFTSLAKKTKGNPEQPITEFVEMWKNVLTCNLPLRLLPAPENSVKLCHLIALYGLLEELNADPIENLHDEYREPLGLDIEADLCCLLKTNKKAAELIMKATKRFSYRCLYAGELDFARPLSEYLEDDSFWPLNHDGHLNLPKLDGMSIVELIPPELKVQHVYAMLRFLEEKLAEMTEKEVKLTQIASTFRSQGNVGKADRKKRITKGRRI